MKRLVEGEGGAGGLRVESKPGLRQVEVNRTARASSKQYLSQIKLIAEPRGDVVFIKADIPGENWRNRDNSSGSLDLVIHGSGDMDVRNVTGSFTVESDGSGSIYATDIRGSVIARYRRGEER
jgi:hypothetical protein